MTEHREFNLAEFRGAVFDLDGTLLDTLSDIGNAANAVLKHHGLPIHPLSAYRNFVGEGVKMLMTRALPPERRDEATLAACLETMKVDYLRHLNKAAQPYPGIPELLKSLAERGLRLGVLSNKPDEFATQCVTDFFDGTFHPILGLAPERPRKPDPAGALEIARLWQVEPAQIIYLGDSGTDMQTAVGAGMFAVGVLWGYRDEAELRRTGARMVLRTPGELLIEN